MNDNSEGNHGYETMLDYQLSWLMRLSAQKLLKFLLISQISFRQDS